MQCYKFGLAVVDNPYLVAGVSLALEDEYLLNVKLLLSYYFFSVLIDVDPNWCILIDIFDNTEHSICLFIGRSEHYDVLLDRQREPEVLGGFSWEFEGEISK